VQSREIFVRFVHVEYDYVGEYGIFVVLLGEFFTAYGSSVLRTQQADFNFNAVLHRF